MEYWGLSDLPVEKHADETLGLHRYATALSLFAKRCETPMTIALQGDWGSGKTSLMNLIRSELSAEQDKYRLVWFNTWQYSQFGLQNELPLQLIEYFMEEIGADSEDKSLLKSLKAGCRMLGSAALLAGYNAGGLVGGAAQVAGTAAVRLGVDAATDPGKDIVRLKKRLEERVTELVNLGPGSRVVVFIDDLDRLEPVRAVELLECFKIFLDLPGCVFFLACDYQIVSLGLKAKLGADARELKGKSFFDKIIQLPFQMPVTQYDVENYVEKLLTSIGIELGDQDIHSYLELISHSIGFNPRNLKRTFNCLLLLDLVAQGSGTFSSLQNRVGRSDIQKMLFACVCTQRAYDPMYEFVSKCVKAGDTAALAHLASAEGYADGDAKLVLKKLQTENPTLESVKLAAFMREFIAAAKMQEVCEVTEVNKADLEFLQSVLAFSGVTAASEKEALEESVEKHTLNWHWRRENRRITEKLRKAFDDAPPKFIERIQAKYWVWQGRGLEVSLFGVEPKIFEPIYGNANIQLWLGKKAFSLDFTGNPNAPELGVLKERLTPLMSPDRREKLLCANRAASEECRTILGLNWDGFVVYYDTFPDEATEGERFTYLRDAVAELFDALAQM